MHLRLQTPYAKRMKKLRQATVEPVLGTLINFMGFRRIWTRGLKNANKIMIGAAIAYNIQKWLAYTEQKGKTLIISLKRLVCFPPKCFGNAFWFNALSTMLNIFIFDYTFINKIKGNISRLLSILN